MSDLGWVARTPNAGPPVGHESRRPSVLSVTAQRETYEAMKGLISEGDEAVNAGGDPEVRDAALIAAAQRVEHYEIAGYGTVRTLAEQLGQNEVARILQQTPDEEGACDKK